MAETLGRFEGKQVTRSSLSFRGKDEGFDDTLKDGAELVVVVRAKVDEVGFKSRKTGMERIHKMKVLDVLVPDPDQADEFLEEIAKQRAERYENETGQQPLPKVENGDTEKNPGHGADSRDD